MSSTEFSEWKAYLSLEPDEGTRADYLAGAIGALVTRVEATLGGKPPKIGGKLIRWDKREGDDMRELAAMMEAKFGIEHGDR